MIRLMYDKIFKNITYKNNIGKNNTGKITVRHRCNSKYYNNIFLLYKYPLYFKNYKIIERFINLKCHNSYIALALFDLNFCKKYYYINSCSFKFIKNNIFYNFCNFDFSYIDANYLHLKFGNFLCLKNIPIGTFIYNVEKIFKKGCHFIRAAGCFGTIFKQDFINHKTFIKLPSHKIISLFSLNRAFIGRVSFINFNIYNFKLAGFSYNLGIRSKVRGVAMNAVDHPHGGGRGKTKGGRPSVSLWGKLTKGKKTVF